MKIPCTCATCGAQFARLASLIRANQRTFCGRSCHRQGQFKHGLNAAGYRIINVNGRQVYEHRQIMEQHLGRTLAATEHVHHKNGQKADNRLENLEVLDASTHHRAHKAPAFDVEAARALYDSGVGYRKLAAIFGVARQNIRACFVVRGWHVDGRKKGKGGAVVAS